MSLKAVIFGVLFYCYDGSEDYVSELQPLTDPFSNRQMIHE
jgi:hypothetical protein